MMDIIAIIEVVKSLVGLSEDVVEAIHHLKHGNPDAVDLEKLKRKLDLLPDLPTEPTNGGN